MRDMTEAERRAFLTDGTRTGKLATVRPDGSPHVVPIWFTLDRDDTVVFTVDANSVKAKALAREPRVSLCVDEEVPPYAFVLVEGTATVVDDPEAQLRWATRIGARYMGADRADEFGRRHAAPAELLVQLPPTRVVARADIVD
jgi:PPOX class probable F420-dependent enzyme